MGVGYCNLGFDKSLSFQEALLKEVTNLQKVKDRNSKNKIIKPLAAFARRSLSNRYVHRRLERQAKTQQQGSRLKTPTTRRQESRANGNFKGRRDQFHLWQAAADTGEMGFISLTPTLSALTFHCLILPCLFELETFLLLEAIVFTWKPSDP
ncbi:unnamed protein product [Larinioides sclopetarius]|uniref:Uncharacterized protein n=1 Tax=Larinioides sclopetarius TaxID=280406 RepID=A0AAV1ZI24_9ARAC